MRMCNAPWFESAEAALDASLELNNFYYEPIPFTGTAMVDICGGDLKVRRKSSHLTNRHVDDYVL